MDKLPQKDARDLFKNNSSAKKPERVPVQPAPKITVEISFWEKLVTIGRRMFDQTFEDAAQGKRIELPNLLNFAVGGWWKFLLIGLLIGLITIAIVFLLAKLGS